MLEHLALFIQLLRRAGFPVSQSEFLDFVHAVELLPPSRENVLLAMQSTLVKEPGRRPILERLFNLYFTPNMLKTDPIPAKAVKNFTNRQPSLEPRLSPEEFNTRLTAMKNWLRQELARSHSTSACACDGGPGGQGGARAGRTGASQSHTAVSGRQQDGGPKAPRLLEALARGNADEMAILASKLVKSALSTGDEEQEDPAQAWQRLKAYLDWAGLEDTLERDTNIREALRLRCRDNLSRLETLLRQELVTKRQKRSRQELLLLAGRENLYTRDFARLDNNQVKEMKRLLVRFGRSLATRPGYRRAPARHGQVDMRRTVRLAAVTGGIPLRLCRQARLPRQPELVVLCDLSGSVAPYSQFMLQLVYAIQHKFCRIRSFAFVDAVAEITGHLKESDPEQAVRNIIRQTGIWRTGFSDYGTVWTQFYHQYLNVISDKTTILILGDARNNYKAPGTEFFREISRQARRIIWLNPAPQEKWEQEDSILALYAPYCQQIFPCRNLSQLARLARSVF